MICMAVGFKGGGWGGLGGGVGGGLGGGELGHQICDTNGIPFKVMMATLGYCPTPYLILGARSTRNPLPDSLQLIDPQ